MGLQPPRDLTGVIPLSKSNFDSELECLWKRVAVAQPGGPRSLTKDLVAIYLKYRFAITYLVEKYGLDASRARLGVTGGREPHETGALTSMYWSVDQDDITHRNEIGMPGLEIDTVPVALIMVPADHASVLALREAGWIREDAPTAFSETVYNYYEGGEYGDYCFIIDLKTHSRIDEVVTLNEN